MRKARTIAVLSMPRTGTNHLFFLLQKIPALDVRFEIFHPEEAFGIQEQEVTALTEQTGIPFESNRDPRFTSWARNEPHRLLDHLERQADARGATLMFKVFPGHLTDELLADEVLQRPDMGVIIIQRKPIDAFISLLKSDASGSYHNKDTTSIQVKASSGYFQRWWDYNHAWYELMRQRIIALGVPSLAITYEQHIAGNETQVVAGMLQELARFGVHGVLPRPDQLQGLPKQDTETRYPNKVINWDEFRSELEAAGYLDRAFDYFVQAPG